MHGLLQYVRNLDSEHLKKVHAAAILYDDDTEYLFSFLQIMTACLDSFAHGSNDVANAVGPLATIFNSWQNARVDLQGKVPVHVWVLAYGGVAIDIGLVTMGSCAELAAALTVLTCSTLGLPVSITHCITGATAGVGLCNGNWRAVNWKMLGWCFEL